MAPMRAGGSCELAALIFQRNMKGVFVFAFQQKLNGAVLRAPT
jgi:hypothetical protein